MKKSNFVKLCLSLGFIASSTTLFASENSNVIYNKNNIVVELNSDGNGEFEVSVENNSDKDMFNVKLLSEDIKGLKLKNGKEILVGNLKSKEKKVLDKKSLKYEIEKAIVSAIKNQKLAKTSVNGVSKIYVPIAIAGMIGSIYILVSNKKNSKKLLSIALGAGLLSFGILGVGVNADTSYDHSENIIGKIVVNGDSYDYKALLLWNDTDKSVSEKPNEKPNEKPSEKPVVPVAPVVPTPNPKPEPEKPISEEIQNAKKELKAYLDTLNESVLELNGINTQSNKEALKTLKDGIKRAKELLNKEDISKEELEEIKKIPFKKVGDKKQGAIRDLAKKVVVDFEVLGEKNIENIHNHKKYVALKDNKLTVKTSLENVKKVGESEDMFLKLNYVTKDEYASKTEADAVSGATPRYKKQEVAKEDYIVKTVNGNLEIEISKLPENVKLIKPVIYVKLADGTYFENGTLVYVEEKEGTPTEIISEKVTVKAYTEITDETLKNALKNVPDGATVTVKSKPELTKLGEENAVLIVKANGEEKEIQVPVEITTSWAFKTNMPRVRMVNQPNGKTIQEVEEGFVIDWNRVLKDAIAKNSIYKNIEVLSLPTEAELKEKGAKDINYRITFIDGSVREYTLNSLTVVDSNASSFVPELKDITHIVGDEFKDEMLKDGISNLTPQMEENEGKFYFRVLEKPTEEQLNTKGNYIAKVRLVFGDATFKDVEIPIIVKEKVVTPVEKTIVSFDDIPVVELPYGANKNMWVSKMPKVVKANLSDGSKVDLNVKEYNGYINTWIEGETMAVLDYDLPKGVTGEKKDLKIKVKVLPKPVEMTVELDKSEYYYKDNPVLTIKNFKGSEDDVKVIHNKDYNDVTLKKGEHYTFDSTKNAVILNTDAILKVQNKTLSTNRNIDITISVKGKNLKMITINYLIDKSFYPLYFTFNDIERKDNAKIDMIIDDKSIYGNVKVFSGATPIVGTVVKDEVIDDIENTYLFVPYESVKSLIKDNELELTIKCDGYKEYTVTLKYKEDATTVMKNWSVEAVEKEENGKTPKGAPIYEYNQYTTMRIKVTGDITDAYLKEKLVVKMKSANETEFTVPKTGDGAVQINNRNGLEIRIPTDQVAGEVVWKKDNDWEDGKPSKEGYDGRHPITKITLELEGYETKTVEFCIAP